MNFNSTLPYSSKLGFARASHHHV